MKFPKKTISLILALYSLLFTSACNVNSGSTATTTNDPSSDTAALSESELELVVGEDATLEANFDVDQWTSSLPDVASVEDGVITAINSGVATITASGEGKSASCTVYVISDGVYISQKNVYLAVGDTLTLSATTLSGNDVVWSSSDNSVVTVTEGMICAKSVGMAYIRARIGSKYETCTVRVVESAIKYNISVSTDIMRVGDKSTITLSISTLNKKTGKFEAVNADIVCTSLTPSIASVNNTTVTALSCGTGLIRIQCAEYGIDEQTEINILEKLAGFSFKDESCLNIYGRAQLTSYSGKEALALVNTASGFEFNFSGTSISATIASVCTLTPNIGYILVICDGVEKKIALNNGAGYHEYVLAEGLEDTLHSIAVYKVIEEDYGTVYVSDIHGNGIEFYTSNLKPDMKITFLGDSITAGYGALGDPHNSHNEDGTRTYAFLAAQILGAESDILCMQGMSLAVPGWRYELLRDRFDKISLKSNTTWQPDRASDVIVINIGTNDAYGISINRGTLNDFIDAYKGLIAELRAKNPDAHIICCHGAMETTLSSPIMAMVNELNAFDQRIYAFSMLTDNFGGNGHPSVSAHAKNAISLAELIESITSAK